MPSDNPKVISYLRQENHALLEEFRKLYRISASEAVNRLIEMFLGGTRPSASLDPNIKEMIEAEVSHQTNYLRNSLESYFNEVKERLEKVEQLAEFFKYVEPVYKNQSAQISVNNEVNDDKRYELAENINFIQNSEQECTQEFPTQSEIENTEQGPLTGAALAKRLGVNPSTITKNRTKENFRAWTGLKDPDGISWIFVDGLFQPLP